MTKMLDDLNKDEARDLGFARVRDAAFEAVYHLWRKRSDGGLTKGDLAARMGRNRAWVTRALAGPGNWTMRTFGELVGALDGVADIRVTPIEDVIADNFCAYDHMLNGQDISFREHFSIQNAAHVGSFMISHSGNSRAPTIIKTISERAA